MNAINRVRVARAKAAAKLKLLNFNGKQPNISPSKTANIVDMPIKSIATDEKRFQNRTNSFSTESRDRIIKAIETGTFDWAKFDPIIVWLDPQDKQYYVLSGHSRFAAFTYLNKQGTVYDGYGFANIPAKIFIGSQAQAIDLALNSNTLATKETEVERAGYYSKKRNSCQIQKNKGLLGALTDCEKQVETDCKESEGKNSNYILNLSYLNREGFLISTLTNMGIEKDNDSTNILRTIANWIGEARRNNKELLDVHETEIAKFLINGGYGNKQGQFKNKTVFNDRLSYSFDKWKTTGANPNKPLNLANTLSKSSFEQEFDARLDKAKTEWNSALQEHQEKHGKYLLAVMNNQITQTKFDELMKPVIGYVSRTKQEYERILGQKLDVKKAASAQTSLFGVDESINSKFNIELKKYLQNKHHKSDFNIGMPSEKLLKTGIEKLPIKLSKQTLTSKIKKHKFNAELLIDLPLKMSNPFMVFDSKIKENKKFGISKIIIINGKVPNEGILSIVLTKDTHNSYLINKISSIGGRNITQILSYIADKKLQFVDNKKILKFLPDAFIASDDKNQDLTKFLNLISQQRMNLAAVAYLDLELITKVIQNFENPKLFFEGLNGYGKFLRNTFLTKQNKGLEGWRDDKEKFKIELVNDIKDFLFTKFNKPWKPALIFDSNGNVINSYKNVSGRYYRNNGNIIGLKANAGQSPYFITTSKLSELGGSITDPEKRTSIVSYVPIYKKNGKVNDTDTIRKPDYMQPLFHTVINVDFTEGIKKPEYKATEFKQLELNQYVENYINELKAKKRIPKLHYDQSDRCFYVSNPPIYSTDEIHLVQINAFKGIGEYYSTLFHEITHSTQSIHRLGARDKKNKSKLEYANEELVAEMGAMIVCTELGLQYNRQNSISYLQGWLKGAKQKNTNIDDILIEAYSYACDAAEYLLKDIDLTSLVPQTMITRVEKQLDELFNAPKEFEVLFKNAELEVINHFYDKKVKLFFAKMPDKQVLTYIKGKKFKWAPTAKAWQASNTQENIETALFASNWYKPAITDLPGITEPTPTQPDNSKRVRLSKAKAEAKLKLLKLK